MFSERPMLRVLDKCKASTRKSLQGLDYFAADGMRSFKELESLVHRLGELSLGQEREVRYVKLLKAAKFYLKGDFRVSNRIVVNSCGQSLDIQVTLFCKWMKCGNKTPLWQQLSRGKYSPVFTTYVCKCIQ